MNAISSYAPMDRALEVTRNQIAARDSWRRVFSFITYFGEPDGFLSGDRVGFVSCDNPPPIRDMAAYAATQPGWTAILNADIVLSPRIAGLERLLEQASLTCAISRRLEFDPDAGPVNGHMVDYGLDIFVANQDMWREVARAVPAQFVIGHQLWDTWMLSFFINRSRGHCGDFTPAGVVWHPRHGHRGDFSMTRPPNDNYLDRVTWPRSLIRF